MSNDRILISRNDFNQAWNEWLPSLVPDLLWQKLTAIAMPSNGWIKMEDRQPPEGIAIMIELGCEQRIGRREGNDIILSDWTTTLKQVGYWMPLPKIPTPYDP